jgi:cytochrome c
MSKFGWFLCITLLMAFTRSVIAENAPPPARANKEDVLAFVKKAVEYFHANGSEKAFAEFSDRKGKFVDRDLYIIVHSMTGVTLAHGANPKLVGMNRLEEQDADGKYYNKERNELMKTQRSFWTHYKFTDPLTHKILPKLSYCEVADDPVLIHVLVCSGIYEIQK